MASDEIKAEGFDELALTDAVRRALVDMKYETPTEVQKAVLEPAVAGRDLVVQARTGTGKTTSFGLPLVSGLVRPQLDSVQALLLCPTRELALQVAKELGLLSKYAGVRVLAVYGGAGLSAQIQALKEGAHIVVGTPGRILDHLERGTLDVRAVKRLVLDEADEMLSMGFLPQITEIWSQLPSPCQVLLFSATVGREVMRIAESRLSNPLFITLSGDRVGALEVSHFFYHSHGNKLTELEQILALENIESAIVFCNTREETKRVASSLQAQGHAADWLNADLSQNEREQVMQATRDNKLRFLVATDVAARGIDISHLTHVINYDFPESPDGYVHRTGRTGRAGRMGTAISLVKPGSIGDLYYLKLRYKIDPIERNLPSASEMAAREESSMLDRLSGELPAAGALAAKLGRRLATRDDREAVSARLIAACLSLLGPNLERTREARKALPEASGNGHAREETVRDRRAPVVAKRPRGERSSGRTKRDGARAAEHANGEHAAPASHVELTPASRTAHELPEVFVNVGKRDGVTEADFVKLLKTHGLELGSTGYVHVRYAHSFVGVTESEVERVIQAINGADLAHKSASAERARSTRKPRPSEP